MAVREDTARDAPDGASKPAYPIGSVDSALRLLLLVSERGQVRIADASAELGVARSTAHRLMQMLHYHGFVSRTDAKAYEPGPALVKLGLRTVRDLDIRAIAQPFVERLVEQVEETAHLMVLQPNGVLTCLDATESPRTLRVGARPGTVLPAFATAAGRAILAGRPEREIAGLYRSAELPAVGGDPPRTLDELIAELQRTRRRGYAVQHEELEAGVSAIAAAISDGRSVSQFAVGVSVPTSRLDAATVKRLGAATVRCAAEIGAAMSPRDV